MLSFFCIFAKNNDAMLLNRKNTAAFLSALLTLAGCSDPITNEPDEPDGAPDPLPVEITLSRDQIQLKPGEKASFELAVHPSDAPFAPVIDGENATLVLQHGDETTPRNYGITNVQSLGAGHWIVTVQDREISPYYTENIFVKAIVRDEKGRTGQAFAPLQVSLSTGAAIFSVKIGTSEGVLSEDGSVFHIRLPYGTDVQALRPEYTTNGATVLVKDATHDFTAASSVNFSNPVTLRAQMADGASKDYTAVVHFSGLPVVYVRTPSPINSKEQWTEACSIQIWNAGKLNGSYADVQIKGRGNSTWSYAKKPYAIKLDKKAEVLGMKKHKRWCLLANYLDHTCMRNAVAFEIARRMPGLDWTPSGHFVDLVFNGKFQGTYYLCEQIKVDENRVNITEIKPTDVSGNAVTGGYLFELDSYYDELFKFRTSYRYMPVQFKDPDEDIATEQLNYVRDYFNKVESILYGYAAGDVFDYIDIDSFVDWFLVNTLTGNREPQHPKSSYMNKDRGGKLKAGPVWDYDWATFRPNGEGLINASDMWYDALFRNPVFVQRMKERWKQCKADVEQVERFIDETGDAIRESAEYNARLWPLNSWDNVNEDGYLGFDDAVARLKQAFRQKIELNDKAIQAL